MYDILRTYPEKDLDDLAWDMADEALGRDSPGDVSINFKNRLIQKLADSPAAEFSDQFDSREGLADALNKSVAKLRIRDIQIVKAWLEQWVDFEIKGVKDKMSELFIF